MDPSPPARRSEGWYLKELQQEGSGLSKDLTEYIVQYTRSSSLKQRYPSIFAHLPPCQTQLDEPIVKGLAEEYLHSGAGVKFWGQHASPVAQGQLVWLDHSQRIINLVTELLTIRIHKRWKEDITSNVQQHPGSPRLPAPRNNVIDLMSTVSASCSVMPTSDSSEPLETPLHFSSVAELTRALVKWRTDHDNEPPPAAAFYEQGNLKRSQTYTRVAMHDGKEIGEIKMFKIDSTFSGWLLEHFDGTCIYLKSCDPGLKPLQPSAKRAYWYQAWLGEDHGWSQSTLFSTPGRKLKDAASTLDLGVKRLPRSASPDSSIFTYRDQSQNQEEYRPESSNATEGRRGLPKNPDQFGYIAGTSKHKYRAQEMVKSGRLAVARVPCSRCTSKEIQCFITQADKACLLCVSDGRGASDCRGLDSDAEVASYRPHHTTVATEVSQSLRGIPVDCSNSTLDALRISPIAATQNSRPRRTLSALVSHNGRSTVSRRGVSRSLRAHTSMRNLNVVDPAVDTNTPDLPRESRTGRFRKRQRSCSPEVERIARARPETIETGSKPEIVFQFVFDARVGIAPAVKPACIYTAETFFEEAHKHWILMNSHRGSEEDGMLGVEMAWGQPKRCSFVGWRDDTGFNYAMKRVKEVKPDANRDIEVEVRCVPKKQLEVGE